MNNPVIADNRPVKVQLEKDTEYWYCVCGRSQSQPFCDGSHADTQFQPQAFTGEGGEAWLCRCKYTGNSPFCDGTHKRFEDDQVGATGPDR